jgi:MarR family transcriptional regulator, organic hydroperoxide resistance regulator
VHQQPDITAFLRFYPQVYFACHRRHAVDERTRRLLSLNQARILDHLDDLEPTNLRSLAGHMGVTASTMSLNVDRLEAAGYVRRERDARDSRQVNIRLTAAGNRLRQRHGLLEPALVGNLLKRLNARDRAAAIHGLRLLAGAATEMIDQWQTNNRRRAGSARARRNVR